MFQTSSPNIHAENSHPPFPPRLSFDEQSRFLQGEEQRAILTTGFACSEVCGMLSIWEGTYGGTIPGIPNWFGLAAVLQTVRRGKKEELNQKTTPKNPNTHENTHYLTQMLPFLSLCFYSLFSIVLLALLFSSMPLSQFYSFLPFNKNTL